MKILGDIPVIPSRMEVDLPSGLPAGALVWVTDQALMYRYDGVDWLPVGAAPDLSSYATLAGAETLTNKTLGATTFNAASGADALTLTSGAHVRLGSDLRNIIRANGANGVALGAVGQNTFFTTYGGTFAEVQAFYFRSNGTSLLEVISYVVAGATKGVRIATANNLTTAGAALATFEDGTTVVGRVTKEGAWRGATYTVATAPSAASLGAGAVLYFSNGAAGSPVLAFSDGTNWLRCDTLAVIS